MENALGDRIRRLREQRRWSQQQLADALRVSTKTVSNWERGRNDPRNSLGAIEQLFGVDLSAEPAVAEPVEAAVRASELHEWRQDEVLSVYKRNLQQQRAERAG